MSFSSQKWVIGDLLFIFLFCSVQNGGDVARDADRLPGAVQRERVAGGGGGGHIPLRLPAHAARALVRQAQRHDADRRGAPGACRGAALLLPQPLARAGAGHARVGASATVQRAATGAALLHVGAGGSTALHQPVANRFGFRVRQSVCGVFAATDRPIYPAVRNGGSDGDAGLPVRDGGHQIPLVDVARLGPAAR
ncbi:unnamed protein product [Phytophthora fragariaefolia]|uniref:Unnamed protein product n=1 Tax=Phytophthora fragariaefolia TaxID=1490495 RepID=A0A9W6X8X7_9STRA|nr:unnamed protein product [Phytophthora fragariaefolia]